MNVHDLAPSSTGLTDHQTAFARDVINGLSSTPKTLLPKYFYDVAGSVLFEQITQLPEYYPTRAEIHILQEHGDEIKTLVPPQAALIELGAGSTTKIRLLLQSCPFAAYVPVDISGEFINAQAETLQLDFPELRIFPVAADFTKRFTLPPEIAQMPKVGFFPGSTLGNFEPDEAARILRVTREILGPGSEMIVGIDLEKDERVVAAAYNDAAGVTAKFNMNLLVRINQELGGDFDLSAFTHHARYNRARHRIEMHLVSARPQTVHVLGRSFDFAAGESIHTENSYKYSFNRFRELAQNAGWTPRASWTDLNQHFSVHALATPG